MAVADRELRRRWVEAVRAGTPLTQAAPYVGMHPATMFRALARGEEVAQALEDGAVVEDPDDLACVEFWRETRRARSESAVRGVALVSKAAQGGYVIRRTTRSYRDAASGRVVTETVEDLAPVDWKAASWLLVKTVPEFAQAAAQLEVSGPGGGPVEVRPDVEGLAGRVLAAVAARRAELEGEEGGPRALPAGGSVVAGEWSDG